MAGDLARIRVTLQICLHAARAVLQGVLQHPLLVTPCRWRAAEPVQRAAGAQSRLAQCPFIAQRHMLS